MSILSSLFRSRDKPIKDRTSGSAYTFFMGGSSA
ncbi:MAG: phage portal protein, partial [Candidatus Cloacimonetes bacterium]|nr:phage portal protein [Candidatus Cloacimonadota bacterium]